MASTHSGSYHDYRTEHLQNKVQSWQLPECMGVIRALQEKGPIYKISILDDFEMIIQGKILEKISSLIEDDEDEAINILESTENEVYISNYVVREDIKNYFSESQM